MTSAQRKEYFKAEIKELREKIGKQQKVITRQQEKVRSELAELGGGWGVGGWWWWGD